MSQATATLIATHTLIKGDLKIDGPAIVAGRVQGSIIADEIEIAPEGLVEGDIHAAVIDVHGTVKGNITATRACRLGATASVTSQLKAANLSIAEGASFIGQVVVGGATAVELEEPIEQSPEEEAAISAVNKTINRIEALAAEVESAARPISIGAPATVAAPAAVATAPVTVTTPAAPPIVTQGPEIRVFPQTVQNLNRAPRIIKAR